MRNDPSRGSPEFMEKLGNTSFHPSVKTCTKRKCPNLVIEIQSGIKRKVCGINNRIPGNLCECPLDAAKENEAPVGGIMYNSISPYNSRRDISVTRFNDCMATAGRYDRAEYQEIISSIVKAARLNGYQIPEADA